MSKVQSDIGLGGAGQSSGVGLKSNNLTFVETIGQSIANVSPTFMPALAVAVVVGMAGHATWLVYALATVSLMLVGWNLSRLASRYATAGSFFVYISRSLGPITGGIVGWGLIVAYLGTAMAVTVGVKVFLDSVLQPVGIKLPAILVYAVTVALVWLLAYRDIKISSRVGLTLEGLSICVILFLLGAIVMKHTGSLVDVNQLALKGSSAGSVAQAAVFAIFSFVGFESAASLGQETRNPLKTVPRAILSSTLMVGTFFVIVTYIILIGFNDNVAALAKDGAPLDTLSAAAGVPWLGTFIYIGAAISAFACALASVNAASRLLFSMGRYQFVHSSMGFVHAKHRTPHIAVTISAVLTFIVPTLMLKMDYLTAFGILGTIATFGFVLGYFMISVAAPIYIKKMGELKPVDVIVGVVAALAMLGAFVGSVYPVPDYPYNILPYLFIGYLAVGLVWLLMLKKKSPQILLNIEKDLEVSESEIIVGKK
ncbi:amino acid permease [Acidihalobacter aeolianus]|uniref:Amino acid permease n=1 Tax=Acidihalobacter aeolianus TaxID=2792603 RepID=A0A1D8K6G3_9GAMM|nr:APC family permease [Acidihalobacter aeolianus]AOV16534.1 amino acid permease [Acidihalobacter aeolianus]